MSSLLCRFYHKILANRVDHFNNYQQQHGFRRFDGVGASVYLLDFLIKHNRTHIKNLNLGFIDIKKALDLVINICGIV